MSVTLPSVAVAFGDIAIPQTDIIDLKVHLGCTNEISSFECLIVNFDKKYTEINPLSVGMDGSISIGRGAKCPLIATVRIEEIICESTATENYIRVRGRCWGERMFRRHVTKTYMNMKAEEVVKDLIENYVGLSHTRNGTELVEDTDTTYTKLEYENTPVFEILQFIAETAEKNGVVGFDFRVEPDAKFAFFPRNSKTSPVSLSERIEISQHHKDIHRVRNKITVYGAAEKTAPSDTDGWTEDLTCDDGAWTAGAGTISKDTSTKAVGTASIKTYAENLYYGSCIFTLNAGKEVDGNKYTSLCFQARRETSFNGNLDIILYDEKDKAAFKTINIGADRWFKQYFRIGTKNTEAWSVDTGFDWSKIRKIRFDCWFSGTGTGSFWIDNLHFNHCRWEATQEDTNSQNAYGLRELVEVDEELHSDNECNLRAKALLDYYKNPSELLTIKSTVIEYDDNPLLPGDKIHVTLPNENIDTDYRILAVEYHVNNNQTLEITLELGKEPTLLSNMIYKLQKQTKSLARYKSGPRETAGTGGGGGGGSGGPHADSHESGGTDVIDGWICPSHVGPRSDTIAYTYFRTRNIAGDAVLNHVFCPMDNKKGRLGTSSKQWGHAYIFNLQLGYGGGAFDCYAVANLMGQINLKQNTFLRTGKYFYVADSSSGDAYLRSYSAGYSYVGTSTTYFKEVHSKSFITHSFQPISGQALEKLAKIDLTNKQSFPVDTVTSPEKHDHEIIRELLKEKMKREPTEKEILEELAKPKYKGINIVQLCAYLIEAIKQLKNEIEKIKENS